MSLCRCHIIEIKKKDSYFKRIQDILLILVEMTKVLSAAFTLENQRFLIKLDFSKFSVSRFLKMRCAMENERTKF